MIGRCVERFFLLMECMGLVWQWQVFKGRVSTGLGWTTYWPLPMQIMSLYKDPTPLFLPKEPLIITLSRLISSNYLIGLHSLGLSLKLNSIHIPFPLGRRDGHEVTIDIPTTPFSSFISSTFVLIFTAI